jgi:subtilisin family serine protease
VRSTTTQAGATGLQNKVQAQGHLSMPRYQNGCALVDWPAEAVQEFEKGHLQDFQERIAKLLKANPSVRVVNISLGYKKSWIQEDNPKCTPEQIDKEYKVLRASWKNLLGQFPERLFVVSSGNESEDFSQARLKENDLWAALAETPNLLLVSSLDGEGHRAAFSNFGLPQLVWEKGVDIEIPYPHPTIKGGYSTKVGGTSASAPIVAGEAVRLFKEKNATVESVKKTLIEKKSPK